ncbi:MAG TPA: orotate phosphoribosyltransferase [Saprospiraceae bacterium]|nr:orotate phosphoribosyltransferase [Saprospiraceae bacterium]HPN70128.1 orotate phosphoribosyltransferase [Saprospiraceae bacterium]
MNYSRIVASNLLQIKAIKLNTQTPFTWASGIKSPIYCDNRVSLSHPSARNVIKEALAEKSKEFGAFDMVAGVATAGIAHGALLADFLNMPFSYVRSEAKSHGRQNQIEGDLKPGQKILVIEDLISTGGSSIQVVEVLRQEGYEVVGVLAIFDYQLAKSVLNFAREKCKYASLCNYETLLQEALETDYISNDQLSVLKEWNADPNGWSEAFSKNLKTNWN